MIGMKYYLHQKLFLPIILATKDNLAKIIISTIDSFYQIILVHIAWCQKLLVQNIIGTFDSKVTAIDNWRQLLFF